MSPRSAGSAGAGGGVGASPAGGGGRPLEGRGGAEGVPWPESGRAPANGDSREGLEAVGSKWPIPVPVGGGIFPLSMLFWPGPGWVSSE